MTEAEIRDFLEQKIEILELGLMLLKKEQYIPNPLGTKSFIDLYARDAQGHHVLIELKRSDAASREALHEIHKYVEGVKRHFGAKENEIRVIVASTEWRELLVPFSRLVADTNLSITGIQLNVVPSPLSITASQVAALPFTQGRFIAPWHEINWYLDEKSLLTGIQSIESSFHAKGIEDFVIVVLRPPKPRPSEHQAAMRNQILAMMEMQGNSPTKPIHQLPEYEFVAYVAMQALSKEEYLKILSKDSTLLKEINEFIKDIDDEEELLAELHEGATEIEPRPKQDYLEIGYPAKMSKFLTEYECDIQEVKRYGVFDRNVVLDDSSILSELRGEDGATRQRFKRTLSVSNRAHLASARTDIAKCLEQNPVWKNHILRELSEIEIEFPNAEIDISIFNPSTGVLTPYIVITRDNGMLYVPTYSIIVRNSEPIRMYYGGLQNTGNSILLPELLEKYYEARLANLIMNMNWGGHESRDCDIVEDMGCAYRSFRCDIEGAERNFFALRDDRWRPCAPTNVFQLYEEYLEKNEKLISQILGKVAPRESGGGFNCSSAEAILEDISSLERGQQAAQFLTDAPDDCDLCRCPISDEKYITKGNVNDEDFEACMCADCSIFRGEGIGKDTGRLYLNLFGKWLQVGGFD